MGVQTLTEQVSFEFVPEFPPVELFCKIWRPDFPQLPALPAKPPQDDLDALLADVAEDWSIDPPVDTLPGKAFADTTFGVDCRYPLTEPIPFSQYRVCGESTKETGATYCQPCHARTHSKRPTWCESAR